MMHGFWVALGIIVLAAGLLDVFLTALNYDEAGFLANRLCALEWGCLRIITRRLSRRWRPVLLRQITGLQIVLSAAAWLACVVIGFGLIYYGLMQGQNFEYDGHNIHAGIFSALYLSAAQLATVGTSQISPETDLLRSLSILETLSGVLLVTLILTFLLGVFQVMRDLRTLSSNFFTRETSVGDPLASIAPYFPQGQPLGLDGHLQAISDSLWAYADGLRLHHLAYFFQSGRDQFSLPYVLHMLGGTLGALRWGLPSGHPASVEPLLTRLTSQFGDFANYLQDLLGWKSIDVPEVVSFEAFSAADRGPGATPDFWTGRFLRLEQDMAQIARLDHRAEPREAYERYTQWLPFAYRAQQVAAAVSRDLDYQPVFGGDGLPADGVGAAGSPSGVTASAPQWRALLNRWLAVPDPGFTRLASAAGATLAAVAALVTLLLLFSVTQIPALPPSMFGGMIGMQAATMPGDATAVGRRVTTALIVLPAIAAAVLGAAAAPSFAFSTVVLVVIVLVGVWVGDFGPRFAALGQMGFMAYYFALLLNVRLAELPAFAVAAVVGAIWAYLFRFVLIAERPDRILRSGLAAFRARLVLALDPLIDAVSAARWDPDISGRVRASQHHFHQCAAFLQGRLRAADPALAVPHAGELRLLLFDTELAANNTTAAVRQIARAATIVPLVLRGQLAGMLERAQGRLRHQGSKDAPGPSAPMMPVHAEKPEDNDRAPEGWPEPARRLHGAIRELLHTAGDLHDARSAGSTDLDPAPGDVTPDSSTHPPQSAAGPEPVQGLLTPTARRAIQSAVATGLAVLAGTAVASTHQYWAALAAFLVLGGSETIEETFVKGMQRVVGTIAGALVGFGVTALTGADPFVVVPLLAVSIFAAMYLRPLSYAMMVFWLTMMLALLYDFLGKLNVETLDIRVLETLIGAALALGAAALLLPARSRDKLNGDAVAFLQTLGTVTRTCIERLARPDTSPVTDQALALDQRFRRLNVSAGPLRRSFGFLRLDGIERRLTIAAALTYYARQLIKAADTFSGAAPLPAATCVQLATFTRDNIAALVHVLGHEQPGPVHGSDEFPQPDTQIENGRSEPTAALHWLTRINEAVLTQIANMTRAPPEGAHDRDQSRTPPGAAAGAPGASG